MAIVVIHGGSDRAKVYQARVEQLGSYSVDLRNLENADLVSTPQLVLGNLRGKQARLHEEAEKKIAEQVRHLDETRASYQNLQKSELNAKGAEGIIAYAREEIGKAQALLQYIEQILELDEKRIEELEAKRSQLHQELIIQSSALETFQAQHATEKHLTKEELRDKTMAALEKTRQHDIQELRERIKFLA